MEKGEDVTTDGWLEGFLHGPTALWVVLLVSLALGALSLAFGTWYMLGAFGAVAYPL